MSITNKYLQDLFDDLTATHEKEVSHTAYEIQLNPEHIDENDKAAIIEFLKQPRKRLFVFKLIGEEDLSQHFLLIARRALLQHNAKNILATSVGEARINPLKKALHHPTSSGQATIQTQKTYVVAKATHKLRESKRTSLKQAPVIDLALQPLDLDELPILNKQLLLLGINQLQDTAALKLRAHKHAFTDGIIVNNLPKGFYIDHEEKALCYTETPLRLPTALAPLLEKPSDLYFPSINQTKDLLPHLDPNTIEGLQNNSDILAQKNALITAFLPQTKEISTFINSLKTNELEILIPLLAKQFILGGDAHTLLLTRLIKNYLNKKMSLELLSNAEIQNSLLSVNGIKNYQKLLQLPAEQREWWQSLMFAHLQNPEHQVDFNVFFEAYTQIFLPRIAEKNLTLPTPCPVQHQGHFLITLNRVLDVIDHASNPQEQCLSLNDLNWGTTGVHYALIDAPEALRFKQVAACMKLENAEDTQTTPSIIFAHLDKEFDIKPWFYRYFGQHWKSNIRLTDIQSQLADVQQLEQWNSIQKNQLLFILANSFRGEKKLNADDWKKTLKQCINLLNPLDESSKTELLASLSHCFKFQPVPSLAMIKSLIEQCLALKAAFPEKHFNDELIQPIIACLENEGFDLLTALTERSQKLESSDNAEQSVLTNIVCFTSLLQKHRQQLSTPLIRLLSGLNEAPLTDEMIDELLTEANHLEQKKGETYAKALLSLLSKINISKSQTLPKMGQVLNLIKAIASSSEAIPAEHNTLDKQESWLNNLIIDKNLLPGTVLGNGDISKLDDLIVDALVDAIKKRSTVLRMDNLKAALEKHLQSKLVPEQLKVQLNQELIPLLDALHNLINLLQTPNPRFDEIIEKLAFFEETKPKLLDGIYSVGILGKSKGEYLLSYILEGRRKEGDNMTGGMFAALLTKLHSVIADEITAFFNDEKNRAIVKDLDAKTTLSWFAAFNNTHSISFLFKEELVQKKVLPALRKTLLQLNTQDNSFEQNILDEASRLPEDKPSHLALQDYKTKIESIANYLNVLIDLNDRAHDQFQALYKQLQTGALARLNYSQKQILISKLLAYQPTDLNHYIQLTISVLEENPEADSPAIDRAIQGLVTLFEMNDLEPETQQMFFKMSMVHNLRSASPFPLDALNHFKKSALEEQSKSAVIKVIIQILSQMTAADSPNLIEGMIQSSQAFLLQNPHHVSCCLALLKRISLSNISRDATAYLNILAQLTSLNPANKEKLVVILTGLANSKHDDGVNLPTLLDIAKGLGRRSSEDLDQVLQLFTTPPYPNAQALNVALLASHNSEKLEAYCLNFDANPLAKTGETRDLISQFTASRIKEALLSLKDLLHDVDLSPNLQSLLAKQLNYIETLGYTDPLNPQDFNGLKKLTACTRVDLKNEVTQLLNDLRSGLVPTDQIEHTQLKLLAYLREIYFRSTGLFPNTTQILVLLLSLHAPNTNLLMSIKTGEGKSLITPMLAVLQWVKGGTVDVCTANRTLLGRDYENNCEPFFKFLGIKSAQIHSNSAAAEYQLDGINCSTIEDMALFRLTAKEAKQDSLLMNDKPVHLVIDECDDALLDQNTLYKLVRESDSENEDNPAEWIYPLAYQFIRLQPFRNIDIHHGKVWDEDEDLEQFRLYINKEINEKYNGDADKQNFMMASSNTQLKQWLNASCRAAVLKENKHFVVQRLKEKDETGTETTTKIVCVPLIRSTPKTGCIFTDGVQQALQARYIAEHPEQAHYMNIDPAPPVLASQSARGLVSYYQSTKGRLVGISGTPGDDLELQNLTTIFGTEAIGVAPYAGDKRQMHAPTFTFSREETIASIHQAIDKIKVAIKKPTIEFDADVSIQTLEEREAFILRAKNELNRWSQGQNQPVLVVCEDFEDAQAVGASFQRYKKAGFKIQIVTGKESPEKLERIIKQAGRANTITVGTAMLARGIDINPGDHPEGLFVIQTYADSKRMTTQIAGRAARNGKPGQWLPIYQVEKPQSWLNSILYWLFPSFRERTNQQSVESLQAKIKLQASVDRLYTQAINEAQQTLMQQVEAWESLLIELYPKQQQLQQELYQWRQALLTELSSAQETQVSEKGLDSSIAQFRHSLCKLWENVREDKWLAKAQKAAVMTDEQRIRFNYLKQLDLPRELSIQSGLQKKSQPFKDAVHSLLQQNLDALLLDKAGAVLTYTNPDEQTRQDLELAQSKQRLPHLIGEFCTVYPQAIKQLLPEDDGKKSSYMFSLLNAFVEKMIEQKNKVLLRHEDKQQVTASIIQFYEEELKNADKNAIQELLQKIKPLILEHNEHLKKDSLVEQFKMQGLFLNFKKLYQQSGLEADELLDNLAQSYDAEIMKKLAAHLLNEFAWVKQAPQPLHAWMERSAAKAAAHQIYDLAEALAAKPNDENSILALLSGLHAQRLNLQDKYLFSIGHHSPRDVIIQAISAIEVLQTAPHCDKQIQHNCHDKALITHHLNQFQERLNKLSSRFKTPNLTWEHLVNSLLALSKPKVNQAHVIHELHEALIRFGTYKAYAPFKNELTILKTQLERSIKALKQEKLYQNMEESLLLEKTAELATAFNIDVEAVHIQRGSDGINSFIELQIESTGLQRGFKGYQSDYLGNLEQEQSQVQQLKLALGANKNSLLTLSDETAVDSLPAEKAARFKKLFALKSLLTKDWLQLDNESLHLLPRSIGEMQRNIKQLHDWDWLKQSIDLSHLQSILGGDVEVSFTELLALQAKQREDLEQAGHKQEEKNLKLRAKEAEIQLLKEKVTLYQEQSQDSATGIADKIRLQAQILSANIDIKRQQGQLVDLKKDMDKLSRENNKCQKLLDATNLSLDHKRVEYLQSYTEQTKQALDDYLKRTSHKTIEDFSTELESMEATVDKLQQTEIKKSRYQTQRFFNVKELLCYEADLEQEEAKIPVIVQEQAKSKTGFFTSFMRQESEIINSRSSLTMN